VQSCLIVAEKTHMCYSIHRTHGVTMSKSKTKTVRVRSHTSKMNVVASSEKTRLVLSCTEEEKRYIKVLAAIENKSISDYLLEKPRQKMPEMQCDFPGCNGSHKPNKETEKVFKDTDAGRNLETHNSLKDFWKAMGMKPNVKD